MATKKSLREWSEGLTIGTRKVQRYREAVGVGTLTPNGYMLTQAEWSAVLKKIPEGDGRFKKRKQESRS